MRLFRVHRAFLALTLLTIPTIAIAQMNDEERAAAITKDTQLAAMTAVKSLLKDPDSAKFKGVKHTGRMSFCGWVNAKNAFGGYTGYSVFYASDKGTVIIPSEESEPSLC